MGDFYGIAEIADELGLSRQLVTVWRKRRSHGIPEPDAELASGPIWQAATIKPWIERTRGRLGVPAPATHDLALRTCRRVLRLASLLLEEPSRGHLIEQAAAHLRELVPEIDRCANDVIGALLRELVEAVRNPDEPVELSRVQLIEALPAVTAVARNSPTW